MREEKYREKKLAILSLHDIGIHSNAVHISLRNYRELDLIVQGIGAIRVIIMWCVVFDLLFWFL